MLALILANGNTASVVQQNIGGLEDGVVKEPDGDRLLPAGLVLELRHTT